MKCWREAVICKGCYKVYISDDFKGNDLRNNGYGLCQNCGSKKENGFSIQVDMSKEFFGYIKFTLNIETLKPSDSTSNLYEQRKKLAEKSIDKYSIK